MTRHIQFLILLLVCLAAFAPVWVDWAHLSLQDRRYANALAVPAVSAGLIWLRRRIIFLSPAYCNRLGAPLLAAGLALYAASRALPLPAIDLLGVKVFAALVACAGAFVLVYGKQPALVARFPLLFLLLIVPLPPGWLDLAIGALQNASAETAHALFRLSGETVYRDQFTFLLPGVSIEIAKECSGIRTTHALLVAGILIGHVFLRSGWRKLGLAVSTVPIGIFSNAVRIVTMSLLAVNGHPRLLYGDVHDYTGKVFSLLSLSLLGGLLFLLRKGETGRPQTEPGSPVAETQAV